MTKKRLADHIADFYGETDLRPSALSRLERMVGMVEQRRRRRRIVAPVFIAASVCAAVLVVLFLRGDPFRFGEDGRTREIAAEIASNHGKNLRPEIATSDFDDLVAMVDHLGFAPGEPDRIRNAGYKLVGARYCSVKRHLAVQMSLTDPGRRRATLYQLLDGDDFPTFQTTSVSLENLEVTMWREGPFFFGLATLPPRGD